MAFRIVNKHCITGALLITGKPAFNENFGWISYVEVCDF